MSDNHHNGGSTGSVSPPNTRVKSPIFVGWVPGSENVPKKAAPRLHHKKSRTGCQQCRARRVKVRLVKALMAFGFLVEVHIYEESSLFHPATCGEIIAVPSSC
jgi:hypothetical protein